MKERSSGRSGLGQALAANSLTALLAERVMGWTVGPNRYLTGDRKWKPLWRFRPTESLEDAFELLDHAAPEEYTVSGSKRGECRVRVRINGRTGEASEVSKPLTIAYAVARAIGLELTGEVDARVWMPAHLRDQKSRSKNDGI
jgi:hypothetical protein